MGVPTIEGLELKRTMDLHAEIMFIEELIRVACNIDNLDDKRRAKLYGTLKWKEDREKGLFKRLLRLLEMDNLALIKIELNSILDDKITLTKQFEKSILELQKQDNYYEKKDDEVREKIILQLSGASERLGESSSEIERRLMEREVG